MVDFGAWGSVGSRPLKYSLSALLQADEIAWTAAQTVLTDSIV